MEISKSVAVPVVLKSLPSQIVFEKVALLPLWFQLPADCLEFLGPSPLFTRSWTDSSRDDLSTKSCTFLTRPLSTFEYSLNKKLTISHSSVYCFRKCLHRRYLSFNSLWTKSRKPLTHFGGCFWRWETLSLKCLDKPWKDKPSALSLSSMSLKNAKILVCFSRRTSLFSKQLTVDATRLSVLFSVQSALYQLCFAMRARSCDWSSRIFVNPANCIDFILAIEASDSASSVMIFWKCWESSGSSIVDFLFVAPTVYLFEHRVDFGSRRGI